MDVNPLLAAPAAVQIHVAAACAAFVVGTVQLIGRKGGTTHRILGWTWAALMTVTAASAFWIVDYRHPSPTAAILLLSLLVLVQLPLALRAAARHDIVQHRRLMFGLYIGALVVAGAFTLLPGRLLSHVVFG